MKDSDEKYLDSLLGSGIRPGLGRVRALLRSVGNPHRRVPAIIVAGTNGKGSTSAVIASILSEAGYRTGLYTSPHLVRIDERWMIDGTAAAAESLSAAVRILRRAARVSGIRPTYFEALTVLAFILFDLEACDAAVLEVGMGGRLDATNVVRPVASVITSVGIDHCEYLGRSIRSIAREKAGIIHRGAAVLTASNDPTVIDVIRERAGRFGAKVHLVSEECAARDVVSRKTGLRFDLRTPAGRYSIRTRLIGEHQIRNVSLAVRTAEEMSGVFPRVDARTIERGVAGARWRGRLERFRIGGKDVFVDGAHNVDAARALARFVRDELNGRKALVLGMLEDKDASGFAGELASLFDLVVLTEPPGTSRALPVGRLEEAVRPFAKRVARRHDAGEAIRLALRQKVRSVIVCGSLYLAGRAVAVLDRALRMRG